MAEYNQDKFILDVVAREVAPPGREARARVHVSFVSNSILSLNPSSRVWLGVFIKCLGLSKFSSKD